MSKFKIIDGKPHQFKKQILEFWKKYLPGTPANRLDWMGKNPAGAAIWLFAIEQKTGKLAGMISLLPKNLFLDNKTIRAGILGDFMLHPEYRVFGPALDLLKAAIALQEQGKFDFLYTIPNLKSKKIAERAGFKSLGKLYNLMKPQETVFWLGKYLPPVAAKVLQWPTMLALKILSRETYACYHGDFAELDWSDSSFDLFAEQWKKNQLGTLTGDHRLSYLKWRYLENPEFNFRIITFRNHETGDLLGFFVVSIHNNRLDIYDLIAVESRYIYTMIRKITDIAKSENCRGVYGMIFVKSPLIPFVRKCCFFDTKDDAEIFTSPESPDGINQWHFTSADRNI